MFLDFVGSYFSNNYIIISILVGLSVFIFCFPSRDKRMTHMFRIIIPALLSMSVMDWIDFYLAQNVHTFTWIRVISSYCGYTGKLFAIGVLILLFVKGKKWQLGVGIPVLINFLVYTTMFYTKWGAWFNEYNEFQAGGPLRFFFVVVSIYFIGVFVTVVLNLFKNGNSKEAIFLIPITLNLLIAVVIEYVTELKNIVSASIAICLLLFYLQLYLIPTKFDPVTGLYNRSCYSDDLHHRKNLKAVISLDLNNLKEINDANGHDAGDLALETTAKVIKTVAEELAPDFGTKPKCYRVGGDEFVILLFGDKDADIGSIDKCIRFVQDGMVKEGYSIAAGFDVMKKGKTYHEVITKADASMYQNKHYMKEEMDK